MTGKVLFGIICIFIFAVMLYDSTRFVTVFYHFSDARLRRKLRLVFLTDLHNVQYGRKNRKLLDRIEKAGPDMILCAGDMISCTERETTASVENFLQTLAKRYPFYYSNGNHEYKVYHNPDIYGDKGERYKSALKKGGVRLLENESIFLPQDGIRICGLDLPYPFFKKFRPAGLSAEAMKGFLGTAPKDEFVILLAHNPAFFEAYAGWGADLTLSGHVHGGIIRLPLLGGVISPAFIPFPKYDGGVFEKNGKKMVVSRGLGSHTIPVRLFNPAELVIIDLEPKG